MKSSGSGLENQDYRPWGIRFSHHATPLNPQKQARTLLISGGRSVSIKLKYTPAVAPLCLLTKQSQRTLAK
jgi:hypothetical protein